jgi:CubicO group peptidase (beta-lactamase class C family)
MNHRPEALPSIIDLYAGHLMPDAQAAYFRHADRAFPSRTVSRGTGAVRELPRAPRDLGTIAIESQGQRFDLYDYVSRNRVAGLMIAHRGQVLHEQYELGLTARDRWLSMSMAKSITTTLVGAAIHEGAIGDVDDPLVRYLPGLAGTAYEPVTVRNLLHMASGVHWDDTHTDPQSERRRMLDLQVGQQDRAILDYVASRPRAAAPGAAWNYSTGETHVAGALVRAATGRWLGDYLADRIWSRLGMEADAAWWLEAPGGLEVAGSGFNATLRDYMRFARFIAEGGVIDGTPVLPPGWVAEATAPQVLGGVRVDYGYMWWPVPDARDSLADGAYSARGIFGQFLYINPRHDVIVAVLSARSKPKFAEAILDNDFFNSVTRALTSGDPA